MSKALQEDFPRDLEDLWDITAKALMLRTGSIVRVTKEELEQAAAAACLIELLDDGSIIFRLEDMPAAN